jgi:hypothetical protein
LLQNGRPEALALVTLTQIQMLEVQMIGMRADDYKPNARSI